MLCNVLAVIPGSWATAHPIAERGAVGEAPHHACVCLHVCVCVCMHVGAGVWMCVCMCMCPVGNVVAETSLPWLSLKPPQSHKTRSTLLVPRSGL